MSKMLIVVSITAVAISSAAGQTYRLVDLGTLGGQSNAFALSESGRAGGTATQSDSHFRPVVFEDGLPPHELPALASEREHVVFAFDHAGRPVCTAYTLGAMHVSAFRLDAAGPTLLGPFAARAINAAGDLTGTTYAAAGDGLTVPVACIYQGGVLRTLPTLGGQTSIGLDIDDVGRVVGSSTTVGETASRPCLWLSPIRAVDLGTLAGGSSTAGQAAAIRTDLVTGITTIMGNSISVVNGLRHATRWRVSAAGTVLSRTDLGSLRTGTSSYAASFNASEDAVGTSDFHAVLFRGGTVQDLNQMLSAPAPGWMLQTAAAINEMGQIVGTGTLLGFPRAFRLDPVRCFADFNQDGGVDGADVEAFFTEWSQGTPSADVNGDGGVDGSDVEEFFMQWATGGC